LRKAVNRSKTTLVGVDGCHGGWLAVIERPGRPLSARVYTTFAELVAAFPGSARIAVDIPIGLPVKGPRQCELDARQRLGRPRMSSVFPVPLRACLKAMSYEEACRIRFRIEGKKMSKQAYGILPKIWEVDCYLTSQLAAQRRIAEVHPELSFAAWNEGGAMEYNKKKPDGSAERRTLIERLWPDQINPLREGLRGKDYAPDDLHDAFAALWSVRRWAEGMAEELGDWKARDGKGLRMIIVV